MDLIERMARARAALSPYCDGLIDQDRYIGSDPVGRTCPNSATVRFAWWRICESCKRSLEANEGRVTLPWWRAKA